MTIEDRDILLRVLCLENTRLIFDGLGELHRQMFDGPEGEALNNKCREAHIKICADTTSEITKEKLGKILEECYDKNNGLLRQNINYSFLSFWKLYFGTSTVKELCEAVMEMLLYYDLLQRLVCPEGVTTKSGFLKDELPYCYEKLCCYIRRILEAKNCFVFRRMSGSAQLVCRSPYSADEIRSSGEFTAKDFSELLERPKTEKEELTDDIFQIKAGDIHYLVIRMAKLDEVRKEELLLVLEDIKESETLKENIRPLAKVLFARDRLKEALTKQYEYLLNLRFDCGFVQFFDGEENRNLRDRYPTIMHISDIHMDLLIHKEMENLSEWLKRNKKNYGKVDLLAISGDLIEARYSNTSQIQENYDFLKDLLREIVAILWDRGDERISFDWKRRIVIVPGNHDFAAVNLFKTVFRNRAVAANVPSLGKNKIMAKFSYYLDFLQNFLDAPIDELMRNHINEVREYRNMNTRVLLLNSSFGATAQRTNKVTLDNGVTRKLTKSAIWHEETDDELYRVCVVHHPPFNSIDYVLDGYDTVDGWKWAGSSVFGSMNSLYGNMIAAIRELEEEKAGHIGAFGKEHWKEEFIKEYLSMKDNSVQESLQKAYSNGKTYFTKDAKTLYEYFCSKDEEMSEDVSNMINRILYDIKTSEHDIETYGKLVNQYMKNVDIFLCGHTHADNELSKVEPNTEPKGRVSVIRKFAFDSWEAADEKKPHLRIIRPQRSPGGILIDVKGF